VSSLWWMVREDGRVSPPDWWGMAFGGVLVGAMIATWTGFGLALAMRCDACGRRPTVVWRAGQGHSGAPSELAALRDLFYPRELRLREFRCVHCGTHFVLDQKRPRR
jgi:hypothetical protein